MTQPEGVQVGSASFGIAVDLAQWERDLDRAEQIARSRAQRIQAALGNIPMSVPVGTIGRAGGTAIAQASAARVATAAPVGGARPVPAYIRTLYDVATSRGMAPADAKRSIARTLGLNVSDLAGLDAPGSGSVGRSFAGGGSAAVGGTGGGRATSGRGGLFAPTANTLVRTAGAIAGVELGFSALVGLARQFHQFLTDSVDTSVRLAQQTRAVGIAFGPVATQQITRGAGAFTANPLTRGTAADYLQATANLSPVAQQFGISVAQVQQLVTVEGQLAQMHGVTLPQAGQVLERVLRGEAEAGQELGLNLLDQYGRLRSVGLSFDELTEAVGRTRAEQQLLSDIQGEATRQLDTQKQQANAAADAVNKLGKNWDDLRSRVGPSQRTVAAVAGAVADTIQPSKSQTVTVTAPSNALVRMVQQAGPLGAVVAPIVAKVTGQQFQSSFTVPDQLPAGFENEALAGELLRRQATQAAKVFGPSRADLSAAAQEQSNQAAIQQRDAQARLDILGAQSDQRRLSTQGRLNELTLARIGLENQLAPLLLDQEQTQDRIQLTVQERLDLTERTLRAQQAAIAASGTAADLSYEQQRVRLEAQAQQAAAISGRGPIAGLPSIPELFAEARDQSLRAPGVNLAALTAQHSIDVAERAQTAAQIGQRLLAIPDEQHLQQLTQETIPIKEATSHLDAAAQAVDRLNQGLDVLASPAVISAEQDLAAARIASAESARAILQLQAQAGGFSANNPVAVNFGGVTINSQDDIERISSAVGDRVRDEMVRELVQAMRQAQASPRGPSSPPLDKAQP